MYFCKLRFSFGKMSEVHLYCTDDLYFEDERKVRWLFDKEEPSSEQVAYCTLCFWICICDREHSSEKLTFFFTEFLNKTSLREACLQFSLNRFYRFLFFLRGLISCNRHVPARNRFHAPHRNLQPSTR